MHLDLNFIGKNVITYSESNSKKKFVATLSKNNFTKDENDVIDRNHFSHVNKTYHKLNIEYIIYIYLQFMAINVALEGFELPSYIPH